MIIFANQDTLSVSESHEKYSGSKDYDSVTFQFSSDWDDFAVKHAVFIRSENEIEDVIIPGSGIVPIPNAFLEYETVIGAGCYGINGNTRRTTNLVKIMIEEGSYRVGERAVPSPDIFQQYLDQMIAYSENIDPEMPGKLIPDGGTEGQILTKSTAQDYDVEWQDMPVPATTTDEAVVNTSQIERFNGLDSQKAVNEKISADIDSKTDISHVSDTDNPHGVTQEQVGLGNADNTADADKPVSAAQQAAIDAVDQVFSYANLAAFPASGAAETVYIAEDTNKIYRWTGSDFVQIAGGSDGGIQIDLLWQNASPGSAFSAQTLSLDLTGYDFALINYTSNSQAAFGRYSVYMPIPSADTLDAIAWGYMRQRDVSTATTGITFGGGLYYPNYASGTTNSDAQSIIPLSIHGISGINDLT